MNADGNSRPIIALAMGDPAGISPELTAKLTALDEVRAWARVIVIGDRRVFDEGARIAGITPDLGNVLPDVDPRSINASVVFMDLANLDPAGHGQ